MGDYEIYRYFRDNIVGLNVERPRSQSDDILDFEDEMEWDAWRRINLWMDHEEDLVDHELSWMTHYYSAVLEHSIDDEYAKFQI